MTTGFGFDTVTMKLQFAVCPDVSVAVQLTVVAPIGNADPEGGEQATVTPGQLSLAPVEYVTVAVHTPGPAIVLMLPGQVMVGFSLSLTVTVKLQLAVWLDVSAAVHVTVVVPLLKDEPEEGEQLAVTPGQLSVAVGAE